VKFTTGNLKRLGGAPAPYSFVGGSGGLQGSTGAIPIPFASGTAPGDLVFVIISNAASGGGTVSTSGWGHVSTTGTGSEIYSKIVDATDIATATASITDASPNNTLYALTFRGFASTTNLSNQGVTSNDATTSRTWTGVTKGASCNGLLFIMAGDVATTMTITSPAMASGAYGAGANSTGFYRIRAFYDFTTSEYADGTGIAETYGSGWNQLDMVVFKLS